MDILKDGINWPDTEEAIKILRIVPVFSWAGRNTSCNRRYNQKKNYSNETIQLSSSVWKTKFFNSLSDNFIPVVAYITFSVYIDFVWLSKFSKSSTLLMTDRRKINAYLKHYVTNKHAQVLSETIYFERLFCLSIYFRYYL